MGSAIALVVTVAVTFVQYGAGRTAIVALGYLVLTFILGSVIQPRMMGKMLGLSTLVIFLSVLFWGNLLGAIGMMLCVPLTMALKFALVSNEQTRWIGVLLEREPTVAPVKIKSA
ncbi:MAG: AI-2E family transporter [Ignavibacteria bacterium]|nr:AI-2E family transporter [Ignavibacteria bacterium]